MTNPAAKLKIYLGYKKWDESEIFLSGETPTRETHGQQYLYCTGPFRTKKGAEFMRDFGKGNPHCQCVDDAERLAKKA